VLSVPLLFSVNYFLKFGVVGLHQRNLSKLPLILLYASVLIALPEEILFRGIIQTGLSALSINGTVLIILSSAIFGFAHILNGAKGFSVTKWNWKLVIMTFVAGLFLGYAFYSTGSLIVPIMLHTLFVVIMKVCVKGN
jgi:membrane protease YdiL (CAAX protease family)